MVGRVEYESRSRRLRRAVTFVVLGLFAIVVALAVRDSNSVAPEVTFGDPIDEVWVLLCAALVFFMQAGFLMFEVGLARPAHSTSVAIKNLIDWVIGSLAFFLVGFALMFGPGAYIGSRFWALNDVFETTTSISGPTFFLFQLAFAGTAITLISGSLVERTSFLAYVLFSAVVGLLIYPVYGHWVWSGLFSTENKGWLAELGFHDFAGGTVVHTTGAWAALVGIIMVGPRIGRFRENGAVRTFEINNLPLAALGTLILWFGWFGFNGGSSLALSSNVPTIILVTNLAGVGGLAGASLFAYLFEERVDIVNKMIGGALTGLVSITPGADVIGPFGALAIGLVAGVLYNLGYELLLRLRIDDALGVVPAHGLGGVWGTMAVALFAPSSLLGRSRLEQVAVQAFGLFVNFIWVIALSLIFFWLIKKTIGLRVSPERERSGVQLDADDFDYVSAGGNGLSDDELARLLD